MCQTDLLGEHSQPRVLAEFPGCRLPEDEEELAEGDVAVVVLVHFLNQEQRLNIFKCGAVQAVTSIKTT